MVYSNQRVEPVNERIKYFRPHRIGYIAHLAINKKTPALGRFYVSLWSYEKLLHGERGDEQEPASPAGSLAGRSPEIKNDPQDYTL